MVARKNQVVNKPAPKAKWKLASSVDDNYVWPLIVATQTMLQHSDSNDIHIIIGYDNTSLSQESINLLKKFFMLHQVSFEFIEIDLDFVLADSDYLSVNTYARLILSDLLEDPFFWFDADLLFLQKWTDIFKEIEPTNVNFMIQGIVDPLVFQKKDSRILANDAISVSPGKYVNAGFIFINSPVWRASGASESWKFLLELDQYVFHGFMFHDQCIINFLARDRKKLLASQFNYLVRPDNKLLNKEVKVAHFAGSYKPWNSPLTSLLIFAPLHNRKLYWKYVYAQVELTFWVFRRNPKFARELEKLRRMQIKHEYLNAIIKKKFRFVVLPKIKKLLNM